MADFTTDFSPAQHAGANTVAPVQVSPVPNMDYNSVIDKGLSIFARLGENAAKKEADARNNSILRDYAARAKTIADNLEAERVSASTASTLQKALYQEYYGNYPELGKDLAFARKELFEGTNVGDAQRTLNEQKEKEKAVDEMARGYGLSIDDSTLSPESKRLMREDALAMRRAEEAQKRRSSQQSYRIAENAEQRAEGEHQYKLKERQNKEQAIVELRTLVSTRYDTVSSSWQDYLTAAQTPEQILQAKAKIANDMSQITAAAQSMAASNPELADNLIKPFQELSKFYMDNLKPGVKLDTLKQEKEQLMTYAQILFLQKPDTLAAVAASSLLPNAIEPSRIAKDALFGQYANVVNSLETTPPHLLPQLVGTPDDKAGMDMVVNGIRKLNNGSAKGDLPKMTKEIERVIDVYSKQAAGIVSNEGYDPRHLGQLMTFFSDVEVGKAISSGKISPKQQKALQAAISAYTEDTVKSVTAKLGEAAQDFGQRKSPKVSDYVADFKFEGGKLTIVPVAGYGSKDGSKAAQEALKTSEAALTRIIQVGAHNDRTMDYGKWWEDNRHKVLPNVYADPASLKPGDIHGGKKFKGGMYNNPNNWEAVPSGSSK